MTNEVKELVMSLFGQWSWPIAEVLADYFEEVEGKDGLATMLRLGPSRDLRWHLIHRMWMTHFLSDSERDRAYLGSWWVGWTYDAHVHAREARKESLAYMLATNALYGKFAHEHMNEPKRED